MCGSNISRNLNSALRKIFGLHKPTLLERNLLACQNVGWGSGSVWTLWAKGEHPCS